MVRTRSKVRTSYLPISARILLAFLATCWLVVGISVGVYYVNSRKSVIKTINSQTSMLCGDVDHEFAAAYIQMVHREYLLLGSSPQLADYLMASKVETDFYRAGVEKLFLNIIKGCESDESIMFLDGGGNEKIAVSGNKRERIHRSFDEILADGVMGGKIAELFRRLKLDPTRRVAVSEVFRGNGRGFGFLTGMRIQDPEAGGFGGVIIQYADISHFLRDISALTIYDMNVMWAYGGDGQLILSASGDGRLYDPLKSSRSQRGDSYHDVRAMPLRLFEGSEPLITVVCAIPERIISGQLIPVVYSAATILCVMLAVSFAAAFLTSRWLSGPIKKLSRWVEDITPDNLEVSPPAELMEASNEVGILAKTFYDLVDNVRRTTTSIENLNLEIAERKRIEDDLIEAKSQADAANVAKGSFLANMSHEIRTPMNAIIGFTDLLAEEPLTEMQQKFVNIVKCSGQHLLQLINDILDFSRIEANKLEISMVDCDLGELISETQSISELKALEKNLNFTINFDNNVPGTIFTDPCRLKQCLINLLGNAVKFTESGYVRLNVWVCGARSETVRFDIVDSGCGIPVEKQRTILEPFSQVDDSTTRKYGGTGLGLAITANLVQRLGGQLRIESSPGKGSTFSIILPIRGDLQEAAAIETAAGV